MTKIKEFFKSRGIGFYVFVLACVLSIIAICVYAGGFGGTKYMSWFSVIVVPIGIVVAALFMVFKFNNLAPAAALLATFVSLLFFVTGIYEYVVTSVYAASVISFKPEFTGAIFLYIFALIAGIISIFFKQTREAR